MAAPMSRRERRALSNQPRHLHASFIVGGAAVVAAMGVTAAYAAPAPPRQLEAAAAAVPVLVPQLLQVKIPVEVWESKVEAFTAGYEAWKAEQERIAEERAAAEAAAAAKKAAEERAAKEAAAAEARAAKKAAEQAAAERAAAERAADRDDDRKDCDGDRDWRWHRG